MVSNASVKSSAECEKKAPAPKDLEVLRTELLMLSSQRHSKEDQISLTELAKSVSIGEEESVKNFIAIARSKRSMDFPLDATGSGSFHDDRIDSHLPSGLTSISEGETTASPPTADRPSKRATRDSSTSRSRAAKPAAAKPSKNSMSLDLTSSRSYRLDLAPSRSSRAIISSANHGDNSTTVSTASTLSNISFLVAKAVTTKVKVATEQARERAGMSDVALAYNVERLRAKVANERKAMEDIKRDAFKKSAKERKANDATKREGLRDATREDIKQHEQEVTNATEQELEKKKETEIAGEELKEIMMRIDEVEKEVESEMAAVDQISTGSLHSTVSKSSIKPKRSITMPMSLVLSRPRSGKGADEISNLGESRDDDDSQVVQKTAPKTSLSDEVEELRIMISQIKSQLDKQSAGSRSPGPKSTILSISISG